MKGCHVQLNIFLSYFNHGLWPLWNIKISQELLNLLVRVFLILNTKACNICVIPEAKCYHKAVSVMFRRTGEKVWFFIFTNSTSPEDESNNVKFKFFISTFMVCCKQAWGYNHAEATFGYVTVHVPLADGMMLAISPTMYHARHFNFLVIYSGKRNFHNINCSWAGLQQEIFVFVKIHWCYSTILQYEKCHISVPRL